MPRNVRNFWLQFSVDGRNGEMASGPSGADGGFEGSILIRHNGEVNRAATIKGRAMPDGTLMLEIVGYYPDGDVCGRVKVGRRR